MDTLEIEEWRPCPGWPGYEVSSLGRARSRKHILKPYKHPNGRVMICPSRDGKQKPVGLHPLVCEAFNGANPGFAECGHKDGNFANGHPDNLVWRTRAEVQEQRIANNRTNRGENSAMAVLTDDDVRAIRALAERGDMSYTAIGWLYGVSEGHVSNIVARRKWAHLR